MTPRRWFGVGALLAGTGVALGAFAAHGLRARLASDLLGTFETGVRYQVYHGLAILAVCSAERWVPAWRWAVGLMVAGVLLFSGSLYLLAMTGTRLWGAVTPLGGVCFLVAWGVVAWSAFSPARSS